MRPSSLSWKPIRSLVSAGAILAALLLLAGARASSVGAAYVLSAQLVKDINPGAAASQPQAPIAFNGDLYFWADDGTHGLELWKSDGSGTGTGTQLVKDINPGENGSLTTGLITVFKGSVFFTATDGTTPNQLWKSDGTAAGTTMVRDDILVTSATPVGFIALDDNLFFEANDGANGFELWKTDGTREGTAMVKDINPGSGSSLPFIDPPVIFNGSLYFATLGGLWKSDGTASGTTPIYQYGGTWPTDLTVFNGSLYFAEDDGVHGRELWKSDGSPSGTAIFKDLQTGDASLGIPASSTPRDLTVLGDRLYFFSNDSGSGRILWKSDGTTTGTQAVAGVGPEDYLNPGSYAPVAFAGKLFFVAGGSSYGYELWRSDGTNAGTTAVRDINPAGDSHPEYLTVLDGTLYFTADDGTNGRELWSSWKDEPAVRGIVADINPGGSSSPGELTPVPSRHRLFFSATDGSSGVELWSAGDFSPPETEILSGPSASSPSGSIYAGEAATFTFSADEQGTFECALDAETWSACTSPKMYESLAVGSHTFRVRGIDGTGNIDPSPAERAFNVIEVPASNPGSGTGSQDRSSKGESSPQTKIGKHPKKVVKATAAQVGALFTFSSSKKGARFACKLDNGKWASCKSPKTYKVKAGKHTFRVRATYKGKKDPTPAVWSWTVNH